MGATQSKRRAKSAGTPVAYPSVGNVAGPERHRVAGQSAASIGGTPKGGAWSNIGFRTFSHFIRSALSFHFIPLHPVTHRARTGHAHRARAPGTHRARPSPGTFRARAPGTHRERTGHAPGTRTGHAPRARPGHTPGTSFFFFSFSFLFFFLGRSGFGIRDTKLIS